LFNERVFEEMGTHRFIETINLAIEELACHRGAMSLVQANWEVWHWSVQREFGVRLDVELSRMPF